jgi:hypothetical protein
VIKFNISKLKQGGFAQRANAIHHMHTTLCVRHKQTCECSKRDKHVNMRRKQTCECSMRDKHVNMRRKQTCECSTQDKPVNV